MLNWACWSLYCAVECFASPSDILRFHSLVLQQPATTCHNNTAEPGQRHSNALLGGRCVLGFAVLNVVNAVFVYLGFASIFVCES